MKKFIRLKISYLFTNFSSHGMYDVNKEVEEENRYEEKVKDEDEKNMVLDV